MPKSTRDYFSTRVSSFFLPFSKTFEMFSSSFRNCREKEKVVLDHSLLRYFVPENRRSNGNKGKEYFSLFPFIPVSEIYEEGNCMEEEELGPYEENEAVMKSVRILFEDEELSTLENLSSGEKSFEIIKLPSSTSSSSEERIKLIIDKV